MKIKTLSFVSHASRTNSPCEEVHNKQEENARRFASTLDKIKNLPAANEARREAEARLTGESKTKSLDNGYGIDAAAPPKSETPEAVMIGGALVMNVPAMTLSPPADVEAAPVTPLFSAADVERIVHSLQVAVGAGGTSEVALEFSQHVAGGLLVRLNADAAGRVKIELSTVSAVARADIEARLPDLIEQLRARGVETAQVKVSIGGSSVGHNRERPKEHRPQEKLPRRQPSAVINHGTSRADGVPPSDFAETQHNSTYLA